MSWKNRTVPPEVRAKISAALKGRKRPEQSARMKGYDFGPEHAANVSKALKGYVKTEEHRRTLSVARTGKPLLKNRGTSAKNWKGDEACKEALHTRVVRRRGRAKEHPCAAGCGRQAYDWARHRDMPGTDASQYSALCRRCHRMYDFGKLELLLG